MGSIISANINNVEKDIEVETNVRKCSCPKTKKEKLTYALGMVTVSKRAQYTYA